MPPVPPPDPASYGGQACPPIYRVNQGLWDRDRWEGPCGPHALARPSWLTRHVSPAVCLEVLRHQPVAHGPAFHMAVLRAHGHCAHVQVPPAPPWAITLPQPSISHLS